MLTGTTAKLTLGILTLMLIAPALAGTVAADAPDAPAFYTPRDRIVIRGDADLGKNGVPNAANGVVAGSGTADDPYVIRGWDILPTTAGSGIVPVNTGRCGIVVRDTSAHLRIEANRVHDPMRDVPQFIALPVLGVTNGICLGNVENVVVSQNVVAGAWNLGISVSDAANVVIESNTIAGPGGIGVRVGGVVDSITVSHNSVSDFYKGIYHTGGDLLAEGNTITDSDWAGIELSTNSDHVLRDNVLRDNRYGVWAMHSNLTLTGSLIEGNHVGVYGKGITATVQGNHISGNVDGVVLTAHFGTASVANATENWWGASDGPGGAGSGSGDAIVLKGGSTAEYDPWLESAPALDESSGGDPAPNSCGALDAGCLTA